MKRLSTPLVLASAAFVAAGGSIHLTEWLGTYRDVPGDVPGSEVVTIGFRINVAVSVVAVAALLVAAWKLPHVLGLVVGATFLFQVGSLGVLVLSRTTSVLGWTEPTWNDAANRARAVEIGALLCLAALGALLAASRRTTGGRLRPEPRLCGSDGAP